ncbi:DEAD/DEAH box helicase [Pseudomonas syringae pv. actinidiae]|nr:DEAD/DEAH box helicase [Pseudomonas syringae pv. actinidiae]
MSENEVISKKFLTSMRNVFSISSENELLCFLPNGYMDFRKPMTRIAEARKCQDAVYMKVMVIRKATKTKFKSNDKDRELLSIELGDGVQTFKAAVFGGFTALEALREKDVIHVHGKLQVNSSGYLEMSGMRVVETHHQGRMVAQYKGKEKLISPVTVGIQMGRALADHLQGNVDDLCKKFDVSEELLIRNSMIPFANLEGMFWAIHRPKDEIDIKRATDAVARLNGYYAVNIALKAEEFPENDDAQVTLTIDMLKSLTQNMVMQQGDEYVNIILTDDQKRCIWNIAKDLMRPKASRHLIMGDVGCGKTFAYMIPAVAAHLLGKSVCILMPNTLLAQQVENEINNTYKQAKTLLVLGDKSHKPKKEPFNNAIVIGTSAILGWAKSYPQRHQFDLVIIDEQQKIGMSHKKGVLDPHTNLIEASATPIPRTLAHAVYGDKKVSYIETCPVEKDIRTLIIADDEKKVGMKKLIDWIDNGRQIAVLYPLKRPEVPVYEFIIPDRVSKEIVTSTIIEHGGKRIKVIEDKSRSKFSEDVSDGYYLIRFICIDEAIDAVKNAVYALDASDGILLLSDDADDDEKARNIRNVEEAFTTWEKKFPGKVIMIHGGMSPKAKLEAASKAKTGKWPILVTSTVIEIGLTMPNLFCMLVVEADNLGASTLHQLRGRLVRRGGFGEFMMHTSHKRTSIPEDTLARLNILVNFKKGSEIAEADMRLRGFGDLSKDAIRQSGSTKGLFPGMKVTPANVDEFLKTSIAKGVSVKKNNDERLTA